VVFAAGSTTIQVGDNESSKTVAASVNSVTAETSVSAEAQTFAILFSTSGSSEDYTISINGVSTSSFSISDSSVSDAVTKINLISSTTGVAATTNTSNQVLLHDEDGDDITIENTSANTNLDVQAVQYDGTTTQGSAVSLAATNNNDATRVIGTLRLTSDSAFSVTQSGTSSLGYATTGTPSLSDLSSISLGSANDASQAIAVVDSAISQVGLIRGRLGSIENRLGFIESFLEGQAMNKEMASGVIGDADYALESALLAKAMVMQEINTAMLAQANSGTTLLLKLIRDAA
jgi:flagellin